MQTTNSSPHARIILRLLPVCLPKTLDAAAHLVGFPITHVGVMASVSGIMTSFFIDFAVYNRGDAQVGAETDGDERAHLVPPKEPSSGIPPLYMLVC
jgi:hypothetical protein